jgi:putative transposase
VKTVPTLRVVSTTDARPRLAELGVADLPGEVQLALTGIASVAREGLQAVSAAAGMAVMQAMFDRAGGRRGRLHRHPPHLCDDRT